MKEKECRGEAEEAEKKQKKERKGWKRRALKDYSDGSPAHRNAPHYVE